VVKLSSGKCGTYASDEADDCTQKGYRGPDRSIRGQVGDPLKVAVSGGPLHWAGEYGMVESLRGLVAARAGGGVGIILPGVGHHVALLDLI